MIQDIIVVDNVFDEPDSIVEFANQQKYYSKDQQNNTGKINWCGARTKDLYTIDSEFTLNLANKIISSSIHNNKFDIFKHNWNWTGNFFFHRLDESFKYDASWIHHDDDRFVYAGVVYLNKNPPRDSGTVVYKDNKPVAVENIYNRLVLYNSSFEHSPMSGFGIDENARLTVTVFFRSISVTISNIRD